MRNLCRTCVELVVELVVICVEFVHFYIKRFTEENILLNLTSSTNLRKNTTSSTTSSTQVLQVLQNAEENVKSNIAAERSRHCVVSATPREADLIQKDAPKPHACQQDKTTIIVRRGIPS